MGQGSVFLRQWILVMCFSDCWVVAAILYHAPSEPVLRPYIPSTALTVHDTQV